PLHIGPTVWMTNRAGSWNPGVRRASPVGYRTPGRTCGMRRHASNSSGPAALWIAPSTPPPPRRKQVGQIQKSKNPPKQALSRALLCRFSRRKARTVHADEVAVERREDGCAADITTHALKPNGCGRLRHNPHIYGRRIFVSSKSAYKLKWYKHL